MFFEKRVCIFFYLPQNELTLAMKEPFAECCPLFFQIIFSFVDVFVLVGNTRIIAKSHLLAMIEEDHKVYLKGSGSKINP